MKKYVEITKRCAEKMKKNEGICGKYEEKCAKI